jgi:hypothetical protein
MGKLEVNRPLGRPGRGWKDKIRIHLKEKNWFGIVVDRNDMARGTDKWRDVVNAVMNIRGYINCRTYLDQLRKS